MKKITNEVLAEKIDNIHNRLDEMCEEVKENTKFRHQIKGFLSGIVVLAGLFGGLISWVLIRLFGTK